MSKLLLVILAIYIIYYAGNIIFDLFFDKRNEVKSEEDDQFSIHEFEKENHVEAEIIGIEDVENLQTPDSFSKNNFTSPTDENTEQRQDLDYWRTMFEYEENIDEFGEAEKIEKPQNNKSTHDVENSDFENTIIRNDHFHRDNLHNEYNWFQLMNIAETTAQLISSTNGHKVYHSSAF